MIRRATVGLVSVLMALGFSRSVSAVPLTIAECMAAGDSLLQTEGARMVGAQAAYRQQHDQYWQGVSPFSRTPRDGKVLMPDRGRVAGGHSRSWRDFGVGADQASPIDFEVHTYDGPGGKGYLLGVTFIYGDVRWSKWVNYGPSVYGYKAHDWRGDEL